jgi:lysophospholipase L1-like esterase
MTLLTTHSGVLPPNQIGTLLAWYKASAVTGVSDGATFTPWPDSSGNGRDATQSTAGKRFTYVASGPLGLPCVRGSGDAVTYMSMPAGVAVPTQNCTIAVVARPAQNQTQEVYVSPGTGQFLFQDIGNGAGGGTEDLAIFSTGDSALRKSGLVVPQNATFLAVTGLSSGLTFYRNATTATSASAVPSSTPTGGEIGGFSGGSFSFSGELYEIMIFSPALNVAQVTQLRAYANTTYGTEHTYTKQIVFDGDSITRGIKAFPHNYPLRTLDTLGSEWRGWNYGKDSQKVSDMNTDAASEIDPLYSAGYIKNVIVVWGGTNDLFFSDSAATTYSRLQTYWAARRSAGWKVVATTILPRTEAGTPAGFETARQSVNTSIRGDTSLYDALADVAADSRIGDAGDSDDTTYYNSDKVHLNTTGAGVVAGIVATAVATV